MKLWPLTIHAEIQFDSVGVEPSPWWIPFGWFRVYRDDPENFSSPGFVLRFGMLGLHFCLSAHTYDA